MKIAIIGAGIAGLTAAYYLHRQHQVKVFESAPRIGGHTATVDVDVNGQSYAIDTGFIVFNDWTYPNFINMMNEIGVRSRPTEMSFSVSCNQTGLEYGGSDLNTLFAQRRNILNPRFLGMLRDILRFNREAITDLESGNLPTDMSLGDYLEHNRYGQAFRNHYLIPMGCAIWSASTNTMMDFPLLFFVRFFKNHGLLSVNNRPQWHVIEGGSSSYLKPLTAGFANNIHTSTNITQVQRTSNGVNLHFADGTNESFDQVVFGCHSDQALALLADPTRAEKRVLSATPYQQNSVVLHTDTSLLPRARRAWSSWNYWLRTGIQDRAVLTYNMNILQRLQSDTTFCVTLNATDAINPEKILGEFCYSHPVFSMDSVHAARDWARVNGTDRAWFAGAYWGNGFHEDGVVSGKRVAEAIMQLADTLQPSNSLRREPAYA